MFRIAAKKITHTLPASFPLSSDPSITRGKNRAGKKFTLQTKMYRKDTQMFPNTRLNLLAATCVYTVR